MFTQTKAKKDLIEQKLSFNEVLSDKVYAYY